MTWPADPPAAPGPGFDLDSYLALPRVGGLTLAPDGGRLVVTVATVAPDGKRFVTALWELDPGGRRAPRRLTRSAPGESGATLEEDERRAKAAKDAGVAAQLIEYYPIRRWDHWLGPRQPACGARRRPPTTRPASGQGGTSRRRRAGPSTRPPSR